MTSGLSDSDSQDRHRLAAGTALVRSVPGVLPWLLLMLQVALGVRVALRLARTARGKRIERADGQRPPSGHVAALVPVLNERFRLQPCLDGLSAQGRELLETLVVDGGSDDGTPDLVRAHTGRDPRLRLVAAGQAPVGWNGKAANLETGLARANPLADWILTVDADVRPAPGLVRALLRHAEAEGLTALSAATVQTLSAPAEGIVHPALLATLVYRFGIPGYATTRVREIQANGQCFLVRRAALVGSGGFAGVRGSVCEDVTLARALAAAGGRVGFYETDGLVSVAMYAGWRDAWRNWTRSLPLRDRFWGLAGPVGLAEVAFVQAVPLPLALLLRRGAGADAPPLLRTAWTVNAVLAVMRLGTLAGMRRAYDDRPWTYWLSPLADLPAALALIVSARRRRHTWRGREIVRTES